MGNLISFALGIYIGLKIKEKIDEIKGVNRV